MKSICLREHEVKELIKASQVLVIRPVKPTPSPSPIYAYSTAFYPDEVYSRDLGTTFSGRPVVPGRWWFADASGPRRAYQSPLGRIDERLRVKEAFYDRGDYSTIGKYRTDRFVYAADGKKWWLLHRSSHMPMAATRFTVQNENVRCERNEAGVWNWLAEMRRVEG